MEREPAPRGPHPASRADSRAEDRVPPRPRQGEGTAQGARGLGAAGGAGDGMRAGAEAGTEPGRGARAYPRQAERPAGAAHPADGAHDPARAHDPAPAQHDPAPAQDDPSHARTPLRRSSVRGQVLEALRAALDSGELEPGRVYSAPALGERYGVSATPVREAMQRLAAEGAVETVPNRGFRVVARSPADAAHLAEVLFLIELPVLTRLAATLPALPPRARALAERAAELARTGDRGGYGEADLAFHRALLAPHGNPQLTRVADALHRGARAARARAPRSLAEEATQHFALLDAIERADTATLATVLRKHLGVQG